MMDWNTGWGGSGSNLIFMGAMMLFWIAVVGVGIYLVLRLTDRDHKHIKSIDTPKAILDRRYAHGEIKLEQYVEARKHMDAHDLPA